jgi:protocatechuate 3,4-dioxygenase beta subunit
VEINAENDEGGQGAYGMTEADGSYTLRGLAPGRYRIRADAQEQGYVLQYYRDRLRWDDATLVAVTEGKDVSEINFRLAVGAIISGKVIDANSGNPIPGVYINADNYEDGERADGTTEVDGSYILRGLAAGRYRIRAGAQEQGYMQQYYRDRVTWDEANLVVVTEGEDTSGINFSLAIGATISGKVTDASSGNPIPGVYINADNDEGGEGADDMTETDGSYTLRGLAPARYRIRADAQEQGYVLQYYNDTLHWDDALLVSVTDTRSVAGIDFGLKRGATISGRVVDGETGRPIAGMDVGASLDGDGLAYATTDSNGVYILRAVPDGVIEIMVSGQGYLELRRSVTVRGGVDITGVDF